MKVPNSCSQVGPEEVSPNIIRLIFPKFYEKEIAQLEPLCFFEDVKPLLDNGLIREEVWKQRSLFAANSLMSKERVCDIQTSCPAQDLDVVGALFLAGGPDSRHVIQ